MAVAGSIVVTSSALPGSGGVSKTSIVWTSDASGNVTGNVLALPAGSIVKVEFIPGTGGAQPTNLYSVDFLDENSVSMFDNGAGTSIGASLSNTTASQSVPFVHGASATYVRMWLHGGSSYQPTVSGAGASKSGTVNIFQVRGVL